MNEDINLRIIRKLEGDQYPPHVSGFLIEAIREEFAKSGHSRWHFKDRYDALIHKHAVKKDKDR